MAGSSTSGDPTPQQSISHAWKQLMWGLARTNAGYAVGSNQQRYALHNLMRRH